MTQVRVTGYVVGYDNVGGELLWKVKVKDSNSVHDGSKFVVHSLHPGTMLTKPSVDVTFKVSPIQVGQEQIMKAVDVAIGEVPSKIATTDTELEGEGVINFYASKLNGNVEVCVTGLKSEEEARRDVDLGSDFDERVIAFFKVPCTLPQDVTHIQRDDFENSMNILHGLLCNDDIRVAFEFLLTQVFVHGQKSQQQF